MKKSLYCIVTFFYIFFPLLVSAQLERKLENPDAVEEMTFHAPRHINLFTVEPLAKKDLHFAIMHTFGTLDNGARNLWGLDNGANIRFSLEYGLSDRLSVGMGRSSLDKVYDAFARYHILQQTQSGSIPISISVMGSAAINSSDYSFLPRPGLENSSRWSYFAQLMFARKVSDQISLQLTPMVAHFTQMERVFAVEGSENTYLALGFSGKWKFSPRSSFTIQWIPNLSNDLQNNLGVGIDLEAGGHVFQIYFVTSQALTESYLLSSGNGNPGEQFRLGFNVNRIFGMGRNKKSSK